MNRRVVLFLLAAGCCRFCAAEKQEAFRPLKDASEILRFCRDSLPEQPLKMSGYLVVKAANNYPIKTYPVEMLLDWGARRAEYTVEDADEKSRSVMRIDYREGKNPVYAFFSDADETPVPTPDLLGNIYDADVSWADLSLAFFWWPDAKLVKYTRKIGRKAYLVEIPAPETEEEIAAIQLWIDMKMGMLLEAAALDKEGRELRTMRVDSLKKIEDDMWMVKDIEFIRPYKENRTKLVIEDVVFDGVRLPEDSADVQ